LPSRALTLSTIIAGELALCASQQTIARPRLPTSIAEIAQQFTHQSTSIRITGQHNASHFEIPIGNHASSSIAVAVRDSNTELVLQKNMHRIHRSKSLKKAECGDIFAFL
jgi:hypothetical protein